MKKNWLFALLCCACAVVAISCDDDDDEIVADDDVVAESAPTVSISTSAGSDSFTINLSASSDAYQYGYVASASALTVTAEQIIAGSVSDAVSAGVYSTSTDGTSTSVDVAAEATTTYYVYAAAVTANGTYSTVVYEALTTMAGTPTITAELAYAAGYYYGNYYTEGSYEYYILLSDNDLNEEYQTGAQYYVLSLRSATEAASEDVVIPDGTYTISDTDGDGVIYLDDSYYAVYGSTDFSTELKFDSGSLAISVSGTTTTIEGALTDEEGTVHNISYTGEIAIENITYYSTLTEDITVEISAEPSMWPMLYYDGDRLGNGTSYWELSVYDWPGDGFEMVYIADGSLNAETGLSGTFTGSDSGEAGTYMFGTVENDYATYSWYITYNDYAYIVDPYAPLGEGTSTIEPTGEYDSYGYPIYHITWDVYDDSGAHNITADWTGHVFIYDNSATYSSLSQNSTDRPSKKLAMPSKTDKRVLR